MTSSSNQAETHKRHSRWRQVFLYLHRQLGYLFAGIVLVYSISGIALNHRKSFNPAYSVEQKEFTVPAGIPLSGPQLTATEMDRLLDLADCEGKYTKHYTSGTDLKVLLKGGSSMTIDTITRQAHVELLRERPLLSSFTKLHFNPGSWWTYFSDAFAVALIIITLTGLFIVKGRKGLWGQGGILLLIGCAVPIIFLLL